MVCLNPGAQRLFLSHFDHCHRYIQGYAAICTLDPGLPFAQLFSTFRIVEDAGLPNKKALSKDRAFRDCA